MEVSKTMKPDIMFDILLRLPMQTIIQFMWESSFISSLVSSPQFRKLHFQKTSSSGRSDSFTCGLARQESPSGQIISLNTMYLCPPRRYIFKHECCFETGTASFSDPTVLGSCIGVLFICVNDEFFLWNPFTAETRKITSQHLINKFPENGLSGLGYDSDKNDYKAVICKACRGCMEIYVYTSQSYYWKTLPDQDFSYTNFSDQSALTINGNPHWVVHRNGCVAIIYFDSVTETFDELPLPNWLSKNSEFTIGISEGNLRLTCVDQICGMTEYGIKDSWVVLNKWFNPRILGLENYFENLNIKKRFLTKETHYVESLMFPPL